MNRVFELLSGCYKVLNGLSSQRRAELGGDSSVQKFFPGARISSFASKPFTGGSLISSRFVKFTLH